MQNNNPISYIQQGEIHIRELNNLLINSKKLIIVVTLFFSLIATIYTYSLKPKYEAISVIEVPSYLNDDSKPRYIQNPLLLVEELTIQFIKIPKNKTGNSVLHSVKHLGKASVEIRSSSTSQDTAIKDVENVQPYTINYLNAGNNMLLYFLFGKSNETSPLNPYLVLISFADNDFLTLTSKQYMLTTLP